MTCLQAGEMDLTAPPADLADQLVSRYDEALGTFDLTALRALSAAAQPLVEVLAWPSPITLDAGRGGHAFARLPHPAKAQLNPPPALKALGRAQAPYQPPGLAFRPAYAGAHVWACESAALPGLAAAAEAEVANLRGPLASAFQRQAKELEKQVRRERDKSEAASKWKEAQGLIQALSAARGTGYDPADEVGFNFGEVEPALARYSFWSRLSKVIRSRAGSKSDLVLVVPNDPRRVVYVKWVPIAEVQAAISDTTGARWEALRARRVQAYRAHVQGRITSRWGCIADRALMLAEARGMPTLYAEGSAEASAMDYFLNLARVGLDGRDDPVHRESWRSTAPPEALPNLQWAAGEIAAGRTDAEAMARLDPEGADEELPEKVAGYWQGNSAALSGVLAKAASAEGLVLVFADCTALHQAAAPAARAPR